MSELSTTTKYILADSSNDDALSKQMYDIGQILKQIGTITTEVKYSFDLSKVTWAPPLFIAALAALHSHLPSSLIMPKDVETKHYLATLNFPGGIDNPSKLSHKKSYIPLVRIDATLNDVMQTKLSGQLLELLTHQANIPSGSATSAVWLPITEMIANVRDHSETKAGWIAAQYFKKKGFLTIAIVDTGIGITGSFMKHKQLSLSDVEAIKLAVIEGESTKSELLRGRGFRLTKDLVKVLGGEIIVASGTAGYYQGIDKTNKPLEKLFILKDWGWPGTYIALRIPSPNGPVDITPFLG